MICQDCFSNKQASVQSSSLSFLISIATQVKPSHILQCLAFIYCSPIIPIQLPQLVISTKDVYSGVYQDTNIIYIGGEPGHLTPSL